MKHPLTVSTLLTVILLTGLLSGAVGLAADQDVSKLEYESRALFSRIRSMGHAYHTDAAWAQAFQQVDALADRARKMDRLDLVANLLLTKATVLSTSRRDHESAASVLIELKSNPRGIPVDTMHKAYVQLAEVYARQGREAAIGLLISEFITSPYYNPDRYAYRGGKGPKDPLVVTRPKAGGSSSITVTAMEKFKKQAQFAVGRPAPDFQAVDRKGQSVGLADLKGKVVLIDFWQKDWTPWKRNLHNQVSLYSEYRDKGFQVIGINLDRNAENLDYFLQQNGMSWPQVVGDRGAARQFGVFGESTNFLLDPNGVIIGRDLRGQDLFTALKEAFGE